MAPLRLLLPLCLLGLLLLRLLLRPLLLLPPLCLLRVPGLLLLQRSSWPGSHVQAWQWQCQAGGA